MTHDEARTLKPLVGRRVTLITKRDSVYVGTLPCVPHHGRVLLKDMMVMHKGGCFKASSGSPGANSRLFNLKSVKAVHLASYKVVPSPWGGSVEVVETGKRLRETIDNKTAWRIRCRGLDLPTTGRYDDERVREIALEQARLMRLHAALDDELKALAGVS